MAGSRIKITSNIDELPVFLTSVNERAVKQAVVRSIRRTHQGIRAHSRSELTEKRLLDPKRLSPSRLRERGYIRESIEASARNKLSEMYALTNFTDRRPGMVNFPWREVQAGRSALNQAPLYRVEANIMGRRVRLGRAFVAYRGNVRRETILARVGQSRLPLRKLFGPSIGYMMDRTKIVDRVQAKATDRFSKEMDTNLSFYLSRL